jgi:pimeloyl-ACP methyl ester carboxylesterase
MEAELAAIEWGEAEVAGLRLNLRRSAGTGGGGGPPTVFVHGVPTHSEDWDEFLRRWPGPTIAYDMPGFGLSERPPRERFDGSAHAQVDVFEALLDELEVDGYRLVVHDWGSIALVAAARDPGRVERLCVINAVPLLPGYRWHRTARQWRTPVLGELVTSVRSRRLLDHALRESRADWSRQDPAFVDMTASRLDRGTFDAILRLYRSAPEDELERMGAGLGEIEAPALVVWGAKDRYIPARFGRAYADARPRAELVEVPDAGHWPWRERPELVDRIASFVSAGTSG